MRQTEDFLAFNFQLINSHLFQQISMPSLQDNDDTVTQF